MSILPWLRPFTSQEEADNYRPPTFDRVELTANKVSYLIRIPQEILDQQREDEEAAAAFAKLPPAEQARLSAEWQAKVAADKEERTCKTCGCDPDNHGGY